MFKEAPLGSVKAAIGCGTLMIFFTALLGLVVSFFAKDPALAVAIRRRCLIGILIGIAMIVAWKIYKKYYD